MATKRKIQLGNQELAVVPLESSKEQAQGFQFVDPIPRHYGLFFVGCGGHHFHMFNCKAPILMVSLDGENRVLGKEIRQPETPGKPVAKGVGKHILEVHPDYAPYVSLGSKLPFLEEKRMAKSLIYGYWLIATGS